MAGIVFLAIHNNGMGSVKGSISAVDLFCGAGGLTKGLANSGIRVQLGVDIDPACEYPYKANNEAKFLLKPIEQVTATEIRKAFKDKSYKLLAGCAPCQPFSTYRQGKSSPKDHRWSLLQHFFRLVKETDPELVTMENVPRLAEQEVFQEFVSGLEGLGFSVSYEVVNCAKYGVPQQRHRLVLLASKLGPITLIKPRKSKKVPTVQDAIGDLPEIEAGQIYKSDPLHQSCTLSPMNKKRIEASQPGGTWRDWADDLVADCHKKGSGKTYPSVYGRMSWNEPAPTMTTQFYGFGNGRFGHPEQDRALSLREGAILQSFPRRYKFSPPDKPIYRKTVGRLIGNAVPVKLAEVIGKSIQKHVAQYAG